MEPDFENKVNELRQQIYALLSKLNPQLNFSNEASYDKKLQTTGGVVDLLILQAQKLIDGKTLTKSNVQVVVKDKPLQKQRQTKLKIEQHTLAPKPLFDNRNLRYVPFLSEKPFSKVPYSGLFIHPYEKEIQSLQYEPKYFELEGLPKPPLPMNGTPLVYVETVNELESMVDELLKEDAIAVDVEHHSYHSYRGYTCLIQISSRKTDYIVDVLSPALSWKRKATKQEIEEARQKINQSVASSSSEQVAAFDSSSTSAASNGQVISAFFSPLTVLNRVFANPSILKVFHGAHSDVQWLQRDFSLYLVNMFDTYFASERLNYPKLSLEFLLRRFCLRSVDGTGNAESGSSSSKKDEQKVERKEEGELEKQKDGKSMESKEQKAITIEDDDEVIVIPSDDKDDASSSSSSYSSSSSSSSSSIGYASLRLLDDKKRLQRSDWRIRPLSEEMKEYARQDTHYLLYVWDCLRIELKEKEEREKACSGAEVARRERAEDGAMDGTVMKAEQQGVDMKEKNRERKSNSEEEEGEEEKEEEPEGPMFVDAKVKRKSSRSTEKQRKTNSSLDKKRKVADEENNNQREQISTDEKSSSPSSSSSSSTSTSTSSSSITTSSATLSSPSSSSSIPSNPLSSTNSSNPSTLILQLPPSRYVFEESRKECLIKYDHFVFDGSSYEKTWQTHFSQMHSWKRRHRGFENRIKESLKAQETKANTEAAAAEKKKEEESKTSLSLEEKDRKEENERLKQIQSQEKADSASAAEEEALGNTKQGLKDRIAERVFAALYGWRDGKARLLDESAECVMSRVAMFCLSKPCFTNTMIGSQGIPRLNKEGNGSGSGSGGSYGNNKSDKKSSNVHGEANGAGENAGEGEEDFYGEDTDEDEEVIPIPSPAPSSSPSPSPSPSPYPSLSPSLSPVPLSISSSMGLPTLQTADPVQQNQQIKRYPRNATEVDAALRAMKLLPHQIPHSRIVDQGQNIKDSAFRGAKGKAEREKAIERLQRKRDMELYAELARVISKGVTNASQSPKIVCRDCWLDGFQQTSLVPQADDLSDRKQEKNESGMKNESNSDVNSAAGSSVNKGKISSESTLILTSTNTSQSSSSQFSSCVSAPIVSLPTVVFGLKKLEFLKGKRQIIAKAKTK
eukprot:MONOS_16813.1-p1 / transcript=MONOS_16813.1 / gene=MONOS_16813 / organism=Monocercomonoides_exilis_PA203 / gene_product=exosome component 10-like / transcript_product=exosome component 10-like / location=Mono_scaffold00021:28258-31837(+) / protein_length=1133 / sequence_SO=supercontig / SO=protein_coding / is_pseudo=false